MRDRAVALGLAVLTSCGGLTTPKGAPTFSGEIVARDVAISIGAPPSIHVKETPNAECGVVFLVRPTTRLFLRAANGQLRQAIGSDLQVGRAAMVWSSSILESCPGQSTATDVVVDEVAQP